MIEEKRHPVKTPDKTVDIMLSDLPLKQKASPKVKRNVS